MISDARCRDSYGQSDIADSMICAGGALSLLNIFFGPARYAHTLGYIIFYSFCCLSLIGEIGHKCPCANKTEPKTRETGEKWCAKIDNNQV